MAMTKSRRAVYRRSSLKREMRDAMRLNKKSYNRRVRYAPISEDLGLVKQRRRIPVDTMG